MDFQNLEELTAYAQLLGFSTRADHGRLFFFPHGMAWETYLAVSHGTELENIDLSNLTLISQKFLLHDFKLNRPVSLEWIVEFLRDHSDNARRDSNECLKRIELNKKIIDANASDSSGVRLEEAWEEARMKHSSGISVAQSDQDYSAGPHNDDWDGGDWGEFLSGPDLQDGEVQ